MVVGAAWFWACPIVYSLQYQVWPHLLNHHIENLFLLNPMTPLVMTFQRVLYNRMGEVELTSSTPGHPVYQQLLPAWHPLTYVWMDAAVLGFALLLFYVAMVVFGRLAGNFAEEL